ncbi:MAG: glycosyltransferase family 2 protein [Chitinophagaceae bacterium]|nr:glycosyltransferase family 2 protein [Chitinophagaceae bacterium]
MCWISIVIPTLNRYDLLENTLSDLSKQSVGDFEIIIVDQTDLSIAKPIVFEGLNIVYHWQEDKSASLARNTGLTLSRSEVVLFLDDDIIIESADFLKDHLKHYADTGCVGVSGAILNPGQKFRSNRNALSKNLKYGWLFFPINYDRSVKVFNGWAGNLSVRKSFALDVGGMDGRFEKGAFREESDFCFRLCSKHGPLIYDPAAYIIHLGAKTGGLRSFASNDLIKAQHHFDGMFYFTFKNIPFYHYPFHFLSFVMIFFNRKNIAKRPLLIFTLGYRTFKGALNGILMLIKGPLYIKR